MRNVTTLSLTLVALGAGLAIALVDTRPGWDDTGITVVALFGIAALCGLAGPTGAWRWGVAVGAWVPLLNIVLTQNYGSLVALGVALGGAYAGALARKSIMRLGGGV